MNLSLVLEALRLHAPVSRARLAQLTGLNKSTVSSLVEELIEAGLITEVGTRHSGSAGRPAIMLQPNPRAGGIIGSEIGVDFLSVIITDFSRQIVWRHFERLGRDRRVEPVLQRFIEIVRSGIAETRSQVERIFGLAVGVPGLVDIASGTLLFAPNLRWSDVPLRRMLEAEFPFPVFVHNEANLAAVGESYFGAARDAGSVVLVSAGVGLGGGIVLGGQLVTGAGGFAGEIGHMTIEPDGPLCNCGNRGCWETLVSQEALFRRVRDAIDGGRPSLLHELTSGDLSLLTVPLVVEAAKRGDEVALQALEETARFLGIGIANLVNALNPEVVVFGGVLSLASDFLLPVVWRVITERALRWTSQSVRLVVAAHGFDACAIGGIAWIYQSLLRQPAVLARPVEGERARPSGPPGHWRAGTVAAHRWPRGKEVTTRRTEH